MITAQKAYKNYVNSNHNTKFDFMDKCNEAQENRDKNREIAKLVKFLITQKNHTLKTAAPIAKRAYRMGIRIQE